MTALDIFQYDDQQVRTVIIDGEPWFVARDVAQILGYVNVNAAVAAHCKGVANHYPLATGGGVQQVRVLSEADMLRLIVNSNLESAQAFERHVFEVILPAIRKTGSYQAPTGTDLLALAVIEAQQMLEASARQVAELTPRADAWDELASAAGDYEVADAAKILARAGVGTGRQRLFGQLESIGWIYRATSGKWKARQSAVDSGYLAEKPMSHHHPRTGELVLDPPQVRVTVRGLERLRVRLGNISGLAVA